MSETRMRETRQEARRRVYRRRRQVAIGGLFMCCGLVVLVGFKVADAQPRNRILTTAGKSQVQVAAPVIAPVTTPEPSIKPASPSTPNPAQTPTVTVSARATTIRATGVYASAPGGTARQGSGTLRTYAVEVETGTAQSAPTFAAAVDATLANPASWAGQGRWSLQRVTRDRADIVIRLATPATVDKVCATVGLDTVGYVSCRAGKYVMINLDRWLHAVPDYRGDVALYRQYVINHEVGHQLGYGHQSCPGPGRPAPVMQQQTFGLKGCLPNAWP